ncbi:MAG: hypothetical protein IJO71_17060, partial [Microbacterium sp.]|nr:hypothetical protein [Microbacterium sp.]
MSIPEIRDGWTIVVPVKPAALGKTRLTAVTADREALARAIALDTIAAVAATPRVSHVLVVTDDAEVSALVSQWPAVDVIAEGDVRGLDAAIALFSSIACSTFASRLVFYVAGLLLCALSISLLFHAYL